MAVARPADRRGRPRHPDQRPGRIDFGRVCKTPGPKTKFVSVAHVSNSLGTINPIEQIIALAHARDVPVLVDGAQSTPHLPVNVTALDADFYVFSGRKILGPTGIGAVYGKSALLETMPPWQGGGHMIQDVRFEKNVCQSAPEKFEAGTARGARPAHRHRAGTRGVWSHQQSAAAGHGAGNHPRETGVRAALARETRRLARRG
jgi:selenocysteine lyase/cysteine desulfurase